MFETKNKNKNIPTTEFYRIREGGMATRLSDDPNTRLTVEAAAPAEGSEVLTLPDGRRLVVYPRDSVRPIPFGVPTVKSPGSFTVSDFKNLLGPYLPHLLRQALKVEDEGKLAWWDIVIMIVSLLNIVGLCVVAGIVIKGFRAAGLM